MLFETGWCKDIRIYDCRDEFSKSEEVPRLNTKEGAEVVVSY